MAGPEDPPAVDFELKERAMDEAPVGITISDPDREDNPIIYANEAFERLTGYDRAEVVGRNCRFLQGPDSAPEAIATMAEAIDAAEPVSVELVNYRADGEAFWNEVTIAPVEDEAGEVTHFVGFQNDVTARKEAQLEVERRTRELDHLVRRINGLLEDVTETLMRSSSRAADVGGVTERVAATDPYVFAWFGEPDLVADALVASAWAGTGEPLEDVEIAVDADDPTARAFETRSLQTASVADTACAERVPAARSLAAVPVVYGGTVYGVLTVYAEDSAAFDARETVVLEALGRTFGTALNARETRRGLTADNVVELEFDVDDPGLFVVDLSARCDCRLEYRGSVDRADGGVVLFFTTDGDPSRLADLAAGLSEVDRAAVVNDADESALVEFLVGEDSLVVELAGRGVKTRSMVAEGGSCRLTLELPPELGPRTVRNLLRERLPGSELVAVGERDRPATTREAFSAELGSRLTDRQSLALQKAYFGGYYDPDRSVTGTELAESMGVSRATFHQHLRAAERKLLGGVLEEDT